MLDEFAPVYLKRKNIKRQTDPNGKEYEEVIKRIKQNNIYLNKLPNISV